jgi:apolipoprotein N-acyltransferase
MPRAERPRWLEAPAGACAAAFVLGAVAVLGFAPFYLFPVPIVVAAAALHIAEQARSARASLAVGFSYGLGMFLAGVSWVYVSLHDFGAMPAPVAIAVTLLFCAYLALFPACTLWAATRVRSAWLRRIVAFPSLWILTEWLRGWLLSGFPWLALGYSQAPHSPLAGIAPLAGVYGVGLAALMSAGLLLHAVRAVENRNRMRLVGLLAIAWGLAWGLKLVAWTTPTGEPVSIGLLQGNVPQSMKWRPELTVATLQRYEAMVKATRARLVVLPETALPLFLQEVPEEFLARIRAHARSNDADVLIGVPELGQPREYFNSVLSFGASPTQTYRKSHLVPFGEFIPLRPLLAPIVQSLAIPLTDFSRGEVTQRPLAVAGQRVAVNICYEDAFGEEIIRQLPEATLLVNVSNVAWFGDSLAPMQHLQIAQMRALETGRPMLRATNTGMTALIDPRGTVLHSAPIFQSATVEATIHGYAGATPFVQLGNAAAVVLSASLALIAFVPLARRRFGWHSGAEDRRTI